MEKICYVYIMASKKNGILYVGMSDDLARRNYEQQLKKYDSFTAKYGVDKLVYYEVKTDMKSAMLREKEIKGKLRIKKIKLIEENNPEWNDMTYSL
ncbi:MAG: GIY-YIG nuclease family protein [Ignavibacteria bacterium]